MTQEEKSMVNGKLCSVPDVIMHRKSECLNRSDEHRALEEVDGAVRQIAAEIADMPITW
jgi:hypothetical protein